MANILEFLSKYYLIFDLISLFLVFSLIGYFVSRKKEKENTFKINSGQKNTYQNINDIKDLQPQINTNMSLQDLVKENKSVNNNSSNGL